MHSSSAGPGGKGKNNFLITRNSWKNHFQIPERKKNNSFLLFFEIQIAKDVFFTRRYPPVPTELSFRYVELPQWGLPVVKKLDQICDFELGAIGNKRDWSQPVVYLRVYAGIRRIPTTKFHGPAY